MSMSKSKYQAAINRAKALGYRLRIRGDEFELNRLDGKAEKNGALGMGSKALDGSPLDDEIAVFETFLERVFNKFVITMVLSLSSERGLPVR